MQLNDLDNDCLLMVLDQLSLVDLFKLRRVNKRVKSMAEAKMKMRAKIKAIALYESNQRFSECSHFDVQDKVLVLESFFKKRLGNDLFQEPSKRAFFFGLLAIFSDIKSIDFGHCELSSDVLLEVVKRCPELQCLKLSHSCVKEEDWEQVLDQVGSQIIHFVNRTVSKPPEMDTSDVYTSYIKYMENFVTDFASDPTELSLLSLLAAKCGNIQQVGWLIEGVPTSKVLAAFKTLPKSCRVVLRCDSCRKSFLQHDVTELEDVVDELHVKTLDWQALKNRYDKLSSVKIFKDLYNGPTFGVDFAGLKKLDLSEWKYCYDVRCLAASQFPLLQEFCFNASGGLEEANYEALFRKMTTVNKLTIVSSSFNKAFLSPGSAILHLKNLDTITVDFLEVTFSWQYVDFLRKIELYVDEIGSLKKLTIDMRHLYKHFLWELLIVKKVKQLKSKQCRVQVDSFVNP